jgi:pimeloyl-ACP methyl ester carboxylesterase
MTATVVLVHGAFHDGSCWELVRTELDERGVPNLSLDLPFFGLDSDAGAVQALLDDVDGPVVLCGHSYGGVVISQAASGRDDVDHLVYLCAVQVESPEELTTTFKPTLIMETLVYGDDGVTSVDPSRAVECFYHDCDPELAAAAMTHLRPMAHGMSPAPDAEPVRAAWMDIPSTYVICTEDRTVHPDSQREMAKHADNVVEMDTSHSPMYSRPDLVADVLADLAASVDASTSAGEGAR